MTNHHVYRGEIKPRRRRWALLLTLLMPGLGHVYAGAPRRGMQAWGIALGILGFTAMLTWIGELYFVRTALVLAVVHLHMTGWMIRDVLQIVRKSGANHVVQSWNHPLIYAGIYLALLCLPLTTLTHYTVAHLAGSHAVEDEAMFPRLAPGDEVLFERRNLRRDPVRRGELVVVNLPSGEASILRVVGIPGDTVYLSHDGDLVVNEEPLYRQSLGTVTWTDAAPVMQTTSALSGYLEFAFNGPYEVFYNADTPFQRTQLTTLAEDDFFVLADNRTAMETTDSRRVGPVARHDLVGRPLYVWYSEQEDEQTRWNRLGLETQ
jgi:signal peptidase I